MSLKEALLKAGFNPSLPSAHKLEERGDGPAAGSGMNVRGPAPPSSKDHPREEAVTRPKNGPPRVKGQMIWTHKTAPILEIEGRKPTSAEDLAASRRR